MWGLSFVSGHKVALNCYHASPSGFVFVCLSVCRKCHKKLPCSVEALIVLNDDTDRLTFLKCSQNTEEIELSSVLLFCRSIISFRCISNFCKKNVKCDLSLHLSFFCLFVFPSPLTRIFFSNNKQLLIFWRFVS